MMYRIFVREDLERAMLCDQSDRERNTYSVHRIGDNVAT